MATVDTLISNAQTYVTTVQELASDAIEQVRADVGNVGFTSVSFGGVTLPPDPTTATLVPAPSLEDLVFTEPTEPQGSVELQDISSIQVGTEPTLTATAPSISMPSVPSQLGEFNATIPVINTSYTFPEPPTALDQPFPVEPGLSTIMAPTAPTLALPSLTAEAPTDDSTAPTDIADSFVSSFREINPQFTAAVEAQVDAFMAKYNPRFQSQMSAIEAQLTTYLEGGTGLTPTVENAIYERARAKNDAEARRASDAAWTETAARGYTIPGGAVTAGVRRARQAAADLNAAAAREIVVMQAEMEQRNLQFALNASMSLRQSVLSAALNYQQNLISINGQALEYAKSVVGYMVEVYNIQVRAFAVRLDAYRASVAAFEARMRAALAAVDLYKAQIDGQQALIAMDRAKVDLYRTRIDALESLAKVYKTKIDTVVEQAGLEKLKLDLFRTQVDAYVARTQGKRAEYDAYGAAINGEEARVRLYSAQISAYNSQVTAFKTRIEALSEVVRAQAISNDAKVKQFTANLEGYKAITVARVEALKAKVDVQRNKLASYETQNRVNISNAELGATVYRAKADAYLRNADLTVQTLLKNADNNMKRAAEVASLGVANAKIYEGLAASAMAGMNTLVAQTLAE